FSDRDMFVCFTGGGIGHRVTQETTHALQKNMEKVYFSNTPESDSEESDEELDNIQNVIEEAEKFEEEEEEDLAEKEDLEAEDSEDHEEAYFEESLEFGAL
ncbi:hypothetical protein C0993_002165, partial [Termitomyces sp. T159_Od127]